MFKARSLRPLFIGGAVAVLVGVAMTFDKYVLLGRTVPTPIRVTFGLAAVLLGIFLGLSALTRARTQEPAIEVRGNQIHFHVNPGRRITFNRAEIRGVGRVRPVTQRAQRIILGSHVFEIQTTRPEGLRAANILIGSRFIDHDINAVREDLAAALR